MKDASKRSAKIAELERGLHEAKDAERKARKDFERAKEEKDREVERVREEMVWANEERRKRGEGTNLDGDAMGATARLTMKRQEFKIAGLEGAVRFLKEENHRLSLPAADSPLSSQKSIDWLQQPLFRPKTDARRRKDRLQKEGKDLLQQMLDMASIPQAVDLSKMPENKLAWWPIKECSRW